MDVDAYGGGNGTVIQIWQCNGTGRQRWYLWDNGALESYCFPGKCLDVDADLNSGGRNGTRVEIWDYNNTSQQSWSHPSGDRALYNARFYGAGTSSWTAMRTSWATAPESSCGRRTSHAAVVGRLGGLRVGLGGTTAGRHHPVAARAVVYPRLAGLVRASSLRRAGLGVLASRIRLTSGSPDGPGYRQAPGPSGRVPCVRATTQGTRGT
ncbi:RICIN domain-containing protein [Streptomyces sp. NBC_00354]|uniref:RICIN domain-containing protein n=1 Tax=Streptomyces sp. NBC_00354 TaxID=2975723 RepID=UPI002E253B80|nr:ricin-type beta-trefoil lectin domain protein [Streptomyces sp. NBC_01001]